MLYDLHNPYDSERFKAQTAKLLAAGAQVELRRCRPLRSLAQNRYLHLILGYWAQEFGYTLEEAKQDYFKRKCNADIFTTERTNRRGQKVKTLRSSADLTTAELTTAIERFRNWSATECGLYIPSANEEQALFYAMQQVENNRYI